MLLVFAGITALILFVLWALLRNSPFMGDCGMSAGPCYGEKISWDPKKEKVDTWLDCPNGKIGFSHTLDKELPVVFKLDKNGVVKWAYRLDAEACCGIPMLRISGLTLETGKGDPRIVFFNDSYSEPGDITLTDDFDFAFLCLSPM